jgi:hypothetical protein
MASVLTDLKAERYVDTTYSAGKNRLCVDANLSGTITIGAVSIKDEGTGLTADVIDMGDLNALAVVCVDEGQKTKINQFGSSSIASGATDTLCSYTVPSGKIFIWSGAILGGNEAGEFSMILSSSNIARVRNSGSIRTIPLTFPEKVEASSGNVIEIKAKNIGYRTTIFEATLQGYTKNA